MFADFPELNILKDIHKLEPSECLIISDDEGTEKYYKAASIIDDILSDSGLEKWKDNSKSKSSRPVTHAVSTL